MLIKILSTLLLLLFAIPAQSQSQRLIDTRDMYPSPSADGMQLVFQSNRGGKNQIYIMNMDGGNTRKLTDIPLGAETPFFSPDGRQVLFAAYTGEDNNDVFVINSDGSGLKQLTNSPGYDGHPHWSANGQRIVFNSDRTSPDPKADWSNRWHEIFSMKADGTEVVQHTHCEAVCTFGSFSPDGNYVLYRKVIDGPGLNWSLGSIETNSEIFVSDLQGNNETNISNNAAFDGWPLWSPDGKTIVFASNRSGPANTGQIWLALPDGTQLKRISEGPWGHAQPSWGHKQEFIYAYQFVETNEHEYGSVVRIPID